MMLNWFRTFLLLVVVGFAQLSGPEVQAARKDPEVATRGQSAEARTKAMAALHKRLSASPRAAARHTLTLTDDEADILANPRVDSTGRFRVGVHRTVGRSVSGKDADLVVAIPGAQGIRLELAQVKGTVSVFNDLGEAHEYTEDGFTHTFSGDELRVRGTVRVAGAGAVTLGGNLCSENASCVENAQCAAMPPEISAVRNAYASILYISGPYYYVCTGGLIADSDPGTEKPYFLTANHCIDTATEASSVETRFQYVRDDCSAAVSCSPLYASDWGDTVGATIRASNSTGDFTLLELSGTPPADSVYLGWNSNPVASTSGAQLYRISHPGGYPQAYSEHQVDTGPLTCRTLPRGTYIYSRDNHGATEGGSSGSPVLNASAQVVGQLYGACGTNLDDECDATNNATVDGAFAAYYSQVQPFLGDGSPECSVHADCDDGSLCTTDICSGGTCTNTAVSCDDGSACTTDSCDPGTGNCSNDPISCDDGNLCTSDSCNEASGCTNTAAVSCDDGSACTTDSCDPGTGACINDPISCDDGDSCTIDSCDAGQCINTDDPTSCPVDNCGNGTCDAGEDCNNCASDCRAKVNGNPNSRYCCDGDDGNNCGDSRCSESGFQCGVSISTCLSDSDCGDDGLFCNGAEICDGGTCRSGPEPCTGGEACDEVNDVCVTLTCGGNRAACTDNVDCCSGSCRGGICRGN